jgi:hypothetical protein
MPFKWNISFARAAQVWEVDIFASFYRIFYFIFLDKTRDYNKQQRAGQPNNKPQIDPISMTRQKLKGNASNK